MKNSFVFFFKKSLSKFYSHYLCYFKVFFFFLRKKKFHKIHIHIIYKGKKKGSFHFLFLSSFFSLTRATGAAGMLNHHSPTLLVNLSVLAFLGGEYLVKASKNTIKTMYFVGRKARVTAITRRELANFIVA